MSDPKSARWGAVPTLDAPKLLRAWLFMLLSLPAMSGFAADLERLVALRAKVTISNNGDTPLYSYTHRLTMPAEDHAQQKLLSIDYPYSDSYAVKQHDNGVDKYLEFTWRIPARSQVVHEVTFNLSVRAYDYQNEPLLFDGSNYGFLAPSLYVESDAPEIKAIADNLKRTVADRKGRLLAAYLYPQQHLRYQNMENQGALYALRYGVGDCTEYAAVFIAISRALGVPARLTSEFLFTQRTEFSVPNHHAAEVFLGRRWVPVDPNLALDPTLGYGFAKGMVSKVVLKRGDSWVWSSRVPEVSTQYRDSYMAVDTRWDIRVSKP
jgi:transglutaminase-like putative cysteine protease